jgi:thiol:disulfide interchange protein
VAGWVASTCFLGLIGLGVVRGPDGSPPATERAGALPSSAIAKRVAWNGFGEGLLRARREGKPVLATFVTDWCPYCTKMARKTWRTSSVASRLDAVVPVRVDAEEARASGGPSGSELAARYGVSGFPVQILLDGEGRVLARYDGYQTPRQLLGWLDDALGPPDAPVARLTGAGS